MKTEHNVDDFLKIDDDFKTSAMNSDSSPQEISSELEPDNPSVITKHTVVTSPWSRLLIIALPFALVFLAIFWLLNGIFNPDTPSATKTTEKSNSEESREKVDQKDGDVYAKLALNQQQDELNKINKNKQSVKINKTPVTVAALPPPPTARPVAQTQSYSPRRDYIPSRTNPTILSPPHSQILSRVTNPVRATPTTQTPVDALAEFNRLRSLGSYGKITYTPASNNHPTPSTVLTSFQTPNPGIKVQPLLRPNFSNSSSTEIDKIRPRWLADSKSDKQLADGNYLPSENQILQERQTHYLVVGEFADGVLVTPVIKQQQSENTRFQQQQETPDDGKRYVARLTADLHDNYGKVAIHKGTLLALVVLQVDGGSYATVQVTSIIKDNTEYPISSGAISVLGQGGKPLIAKQFQDKGGEIARYDLTFGLVGGLSQVGTILNQSDSSTSVANSATGTFSSSTTSNSQRNIGGAFLQGAFGKLNDIIGKRAETSNQEIAARPNVWYIPQGTKITFLVNRSLELP